MRYVGGWTIAKLRYENSQALRKKLFTHRKLAELNEVNDKLRLLDSLRAAEETLQAISSDPASLEVTAFKQNMRWGLTNITDSAQEFFLLLSEKVTQLETEETLHEHGKDMFKFVTDELQKDESLCDKWNELFTLGNEQDPESLSVLAKTLFQ